MLVYQNVLSASSSKLPHFETTVNVSYVTARRSQSCPLADKAIQLPALTTHAVQYVFPGLPHLFALSLSLHIHDGKVVESSSLRNSFEIRNYPTAVIIFYSSLVFLPCVVKAGPVTTSNSIQLKCLSPDTCQRSVLPCHCVGTNYTRPEHQREPLFNCYVRITRCYKA
jgi:hypothetical protein